MTSMLTWAQHLPSGPMYTFIFLWLFVESTGFPISDEPVLLIAGYLTHMRRLDVVAVVGVALLGKLMASCLAYWLGRRISLLWMARPMIRPARGIGRWLHVVRPTAAAILAAEQRFRRFGVWSVFLGRLVPVVRSFISYPAGAARLPFWLFFAATAAGSFLWIVTWTLLGIGLGASYQIALTRWGSLSRLILAACAFALGVLWLWSHRHTRRQTQ
ncbi:MAG TPA: DedA family protein [Ktedonobacterales bacterium]|nr:DedA family protein [Ktedonobacterales bacterium]